MSLWNGAPNGDLLLPLDKRSRLTRLPNLQGNRFTIRTFDIPDEWTKAHPRDEATGRFIKRQK